MPVDRDHKGRAFVRDSASESKFESKTAGNAASRSTAGAGLGSIAANRPKLPKRSEFSDDASYSKAYKGYMDARNSDPGAVAQKKALERMGK